MTGEQGVTVRAGAITALLGAMGSWLLITVLRSVGGAAPHLSWMGLVPLVALIGLVLVMTWQIRRYLRGEGALRPSPQRARATLVGAQAAALGGSLLVGWYAANALIHLPLLDVGSHREQLLWALVHAAAALVLAVSGYVGQAWCRIPPKDDEDGDGGGGRVPDGDLAYG